MSEGQFSHLPRSHGVRLRGLQMTRLETFADAAFAFSITLLVISIDSIPSSYDELLGALKRAPAFLLSFIQIMIFWAGHRRWSRWYGLEDVPSTLGTLLLVFLVLVFVYPLKIIFSGLLNWATDGWLPFDFALASAEELTGVFAIYGFAFASLAATMVLLYLRALGCRQTLGLDALEVLRTREEIAGWAVVAATGLASALVALLAPVRIGVYSGFLYFILTFAPALAGRPFARQARRLAASG
ncbi:MAG: TMEM175 family protein [Gammaproteobacteria bacterium]